MHLQPDDTNEPVAHCSQAKPACEEANSKTGKLRIYKRYIDNQIVIEQQDHLVAEQFAPSYQLRQQSRIDRIDRCWFLCRQFEVVNIYPYWLGMH